MKTAADFTTEQIQEMRNWILDCDCDDSDLSDNDVIRFVERNYDGGLKSFDFGN